MNDNNKNEIVTLNRQILVTDEDKYGTDLTKMSNFFELNIDNQLRELFNTNELSVINKFSISNASQVLDCEKVIDSLDKNEVELVADLDSLPDKIKKKLKDNIDFIKKSKQVEDRYRPVVLDKNSNIEKEIVLKKVTKRIDNSSALRNIATQEKLKQLDTKLDELMELSSYQIDLQRNQLIFKPFDEARREILIAQECTSEDAKNEHFKEAIKHLNESLSGIKSTLKTSSEHLINLDNKKIKIPFISMDKYIRDIGVDLFSLTKLVGLQSNVYLLLGKKAEYNVLIDEYSSIIKDFFTKEISHNRSLSLLVHDNRKYKKTNKDMWVNLYNNYNDKINDKLEEKEVYYLTMEENENGKEQ